MVLRTAKYNEGFETQQSSHNNNITCMFKAIHPYYIIRMIHVLENHKHDKKPKNISNVHINNQFSITQQKY